MINILETREKGNKREMRTLNFGTQMKEQSNMQDKW